MGNVKCAGVYCGGLLIALIGDGVHLQCVQMCDGMCSRSVGLSIHSTRRDALRDRSGSALIDFVDIVDIAQMDAWRIPFLILFVVRGPCDPRHIQHIGYALGNQNHFWEFDSFVLCVECLTRLWRSDEHGALWC